MAQKEPPGRILAWNACYNARELGGYPAEGGGWTRWGVLIRADNLDRLTPQGQAALYDYGVRTVIDLRQAHEVAAHPSPFAAQEDSTSRVARPRYMNLPLHDPQVDAAMEAADTLQDEYIILVERSKPLVAAVIEAVGAGMDNGGVVIHCHGGKDRTGIVAALLLSLAGVPRDTIVEDYALSEAQLEPSFARWLKEESRTRGGPIERPRWMGSRAETMYGLLDYLDRQYGGPAGYLEAAGVSRPCMAQIRSHLIMRADDEKGLSML